MYEQAVYLFMNIYIYKQLNKRIGHTWEGVEEGKGKMKNTVIIISKGIYTYILYINAYILIAYVCIKNQRSHDIGKQLPCHPIY